MDAILIAIVVLRTVKSINTLKPHNYECTMKVNFPAWNTSHDGPCLQVLVNLYSQHAGDSKDWLEVFCS